MILDILLASLWGLPCWLWLLLAGIIPFILGCLFCRATRKKEDKSEDNSASYSSSGGVMGGDMRAMQDRLNHFEKNEAELKYKVEQLELDLKACRDKRQMLEMQNLEYKARLEELGELNKKTGDDASMKVAAGAVNLADVDRGTYGAFFSSDNLQVVEGVGPKVEAILKGNGIQDWSALAAKSPDQLRAILKDNKLQMMNPDSWPKQAALAAAGKWDELSEFQKFLDGGRSDTGDFETPAKIDKLAAAGGLIVGAEKSGKDTGINFAAIFDQDNLQIVEGIGPKVEKLLKKNGISTLALLAATTPDTLKQILADNKLQMMNPDSWPKQAKLASEDKWGELIELQKFLDTGRENTGDFETPSKVEKMAIKILGFSQNPEDLKIVEGIGPKIEGILKAEGVNTWSDLAGTSVGRLKEILAAAGDRYKLAKPNTWPKQAGLAAAGKWGELQEYQDYLDKGVDPNG